MRILITGGSGFIGTNLVEYYLSNGATVVNIDIAPPKIPAHTPYWKNINILDIESLRAEVSNFSPSHIINLAAQTGTSDRGRKLEDYATNIQGVRNVIEAAKGSSAVERIIFTSSMAVCRIDYQPKSGDDYCPETLYGGSKVLGEKVVREAGESPYSWVIVRPTGIWGPWFDVPYKNLFNMIQRGLYVHPKGIKVTQSMGFVGNTVYQLDNLLQAPKQQVHGRTLYLADSQPLDMQEWTNLIQKAFNARRIYTLPVWALKITAVAGDALKLAGVEVPPLSTTRLKNILTSFVFDIDSTISGNLPYDLDEAVQITVDWMRNKKLPVK